MQPIALIADDDTLTLFFMEQILLPAGMQVLKAEDGLQAVEILQEVVPSIIFLDLLMPRLSGLDVINFIMENHLLRDVPVVIVTAHNRERFAQFPQVARADAYLLKPIRPQDIREFARQAAGR